MAYASVQARIKPELKAQADEIFESIGISTADAIRMFIQHTVNVGGLPFTPMAKRPNATLRAAMTEIEQGGGHRSSSGSDSALRLVHLKGILKGCDFSPTLLAEARREMWKKFDTNPL